MNKPNNVHTHCKQQNSNGGFTLLELMVVIVIIGIMFSFLALSIRVDSPEEAIKTEAQRLNQLIQVALEKAILRGEEYGIVFKPNSYQFAHLTENGWQTIEKDRSLRLRELPQDIIMELEVDQRGFSFTSDQEKSRIEPQVFLLSSGEITPEFTVNMTIIGANTTYRIVGKMNGQHSVNSNER